MSQTMSMRAYARYRGVSDGAVRKAVSTGRITPNADGSIDVARADQEWQLNTDSAPQRGVHRPVPNEAIQSVKQTLADSGVMTHGSGGSGMGGAVGGPGGSTTLLQARTANEVLKAQTNKVRLSRLKGELVDRPEAVAHVYRMARSEREAWLNWPARVALQMASDLQVPPHRMYTLLESAVRQQLIEIGEMAVQIN
jgi:hypothetical protein